MPASRFLACLMDKIRETLNKPKTVIAGAVKQSRKPQRSPGCGSPCRYASRDGMLIQRFFNYFFWGR